MSCVCEEVGQMEGDLEVESLLNSRCRRRSREKILSAARGGMLQRLDAARTRSVFMPICGFVLFLLLKLFLIINLKLNSMKQTNLSCF